MGFTTRPSKNRKRKCTEARRLARETNTVIDVNKRTVENSEISQVTNTQPQYTAKAPRSGKISPKQQEQGGQVSVITQSKRDPANTNR